jgi:4-diphosphocytidyl-2-C-methyl-D-erythritol kinase
MRVAVMTPTASLTTRAKLNLSLTITGKRTDGYHLLQSLVAFCEVGDVVTATPAPTLSLTVSGRFAEHIHADATNLVLRAAHLLQHHTGTSQGAALHVDKHLPVASGIGGGSGDAAATLHLLNQLWECDLSISDLATLAASLGSDVPVCIHANACWMEGIGERITPLTVPLPPLYAVLVNPLTPLSTPTVFAECRANEWSGEQPHEVSLTSLRNDLTAAAIRMCPEIGDILAALRHTPNALFAGMSGSGATCFALYESKKGAATTRMSLQHLFPSHWMAYGRLH